MTIMEVIKESMTIRITTMKVTKEEILKDNKFLFGNSQFMEEGGGFFIYYYN